MLRCATASVGSRVAAARYCSGLLGAHRRLRQRAVGHNVITRDGKAGFIDILTAGKGRGASGHGQARRDRRGQAGGRHSCAHDRV